ncbi:MAG: hypothetical protein II933_00760 [Candidatus Methanomethylophilaceae archaeon]|nr:hypothetical protein [Candidatus Methanomethylophilaceae archaeon]
MESRILVPLLQDADDRLVQFLGDILRHRLLQELDGHHPSGGGHRQVGEAEMAVDGALGDLHLMDPLDGDQGVAHNEDAPADLHLVGIDPVAVPAEEHDWRDKLVGDEYRDNDAEGNPGLRREVGQVPLEEQVVERQESEPCGDAYGITCVHRRNCRSLETAIAVLGEAVLIHFESVHIRCASVGSATMQDGYKTKPREQVPDRHRDNDSP